MRAVEYDRYGSVDVLVAREVPRPGPPKQGHLLVRVHAAALNPKDALVRKGRFRWLSRGGFPKRIGLDFAGEIEAIGPGVSGHRLGDRVFGALEEVTARRGTVADYVVCEERELARAPRVSFVEAAAFPLAATTALQALRDHGRVGPGARLLVHGGSGGVGTMAIPIARWLGAHVTSTSSAKNLELCASLGADETLDYARFDGRPPTGIGPFDVVFDVFGNLSFDGVRTILAERGVYVTTVPSARALLDRARTMLLARRARLVLVRARTTDFAIVADLVDRGILRPVLDRVVPFEQIAAAVRALETKRTRGKIVIDLER